MIPLLLPFLAVALIIAFGESSPSRPAGQPGPAPGAPPSPDLLTQLQRQVLGALVNQQYGAPAAQGAALPSGSVPLSIPATTGPVVPQVSIAGTPSAAAATALQGYIAQGGNDPSVISGAQALMGGIATDGIVGPNTRARARALGVNWPEPSGTVAQAPMQSVPSGTYFDRHGVNPFLPLPSGHDAALALAAIVATHPRSEDRSTADLMRSIATFQMAMGFSGGDVDGVIGPNTLARMLGQAPELATQLQNAVQGGSS